MHAFRRQWTAILGSHVPLAALVVAMLLTLAAPGTMAQSVIVLHTFSGGADGAAPAASLTPDAGGNLYGTTYYGGSIAGHCWESGCGVVFKMTHRGSGWIETPIYKFQNAPDGTNPQARVVFGPDGALYGTTWGGGTGSCFNTGCGTVFKLDPSPHACGNSACPWRETVLYSFTSFPDGAFPAAEVVFDRAGNLYGTTSSGGVGPCEGGCGTVFKLTSNGNGSWSKSTIYFFRGGADDGIDPNSALVFDPAGNLYGTTYYGGTYDCYGGSIPGCGTVFEVTPSGSGWKESVVHIFTDGIDGGYPTGLAFDGQGNLFGTASTGPYVQLGEYGSGTMFEMTPGQNGQWTFTVPYTFPNIGDGAEYPNAPVLDASGNVYGSGGRGGEAGWGAAYKLTYSNGVWNYATLGSFDLQGPPGSLPQGAPVMDAQGNLYGVCEDGPYPSPDAGTVWEVTP